MPLDDAFADGKANSRSGILLPCMQALEYLENAFGEFGFEANAVVLHSKQPFMPTVTGGDMDSRCLLAAELDGIADEVLQ